MCEGRTPPTVAPSPTGNRLTRITTLTLNPALDESTEVERVTPDDKLRCGPVRVDPGGGGINVARVVGRLGHEVTAVVTVGGPPGAQLAALLAERDRVTVEPVTVEGRTRTGLHVDETSTGSQYRFVMPGPELSAGELEAAVDAALAGPPDLLVASGSLPPGVPEDAYADLCRRATGLGVRVIVDSSGPALAAVVGAGAFLLKPNARELEQLCGGSLPDGGLEAAAQRLVEDRAAEVVVLSLGAGGIYLATADGGEHLRAPTVAIESRVGAGDSTVGGIVAGLARGWPVRDAVRLGLAAGAAAVMTPGTELARAEAVERLYATAAG